MFGARQGKSNLPHRSLLRLAYWQQVLGHVSEMPTVTEKWIIDRLSDKALPGPKPCAAVTQLVAGECTDERTVIHSERKLVGRVWMRTLPNCGLIWSCSIVLFAFPAPRRLIR